MAAMTVVAIRVIDGEPLIPLLQSLAIKVGLVFGYMFEGPDRREVADSCEAANMNRPLSPDNRHDSFHDALYGTS